MLIGNGNIILEFHFPLTKNNNKPCISVQGFVLYRHFKRLGEFMTTSLKLKAAIAMTIASTDTYHLRNRANDFIFTGLAEKPFYQKLNDKRNKRRFAKGGK